MKKITLLFLFISIFSIGDVFAQADQSYVINGGSTSGLGRAPQGQRNVTRSVWLITAAEMTAGGFVTGDAISGLGFTYQIPQNTPTTGTFVVYLQNTTDATNTKSLTWATAITGMTTVSNGTATVPNTAGEINYNFSGGSPFTYTGGSLYIAYDYQTVAPATVANVAFCNTALAGGIKTGLSAAGVTTPPTAIVASNFRPATRLGKPVACARPYNMYSNVATNTATSAQLFYNPGVGSVNNVEIEYGPYDFVQGTGTTITNITASPYYLTPLTGNSVYDMYIRTNCGGGSYSIWNGPYSFNTVFDAVTPPYNTGFEQDHLNFIGWSTPTILPVAGDWVTGNYGTGPLVQQGIYSATSVTPTVAANNFMFSRGMNLTTGSTVTVNFYISNYVGNGSVNTGNYGLTVGTSPTAVAQTTVMGTESGISSATFALKSYSYVVPSSGVYYFGVRNFSPANAVGTHALLVDNFTVTEALSTDAFLASNLTISPNPANDLVTVSATDLSLTSVTMTDINGRVVRNNTLNNVTETQINISDLSQGVYFVKITSDKGVATKKLVVE